MLAGERVMPDDQLERENPCGETTAAEFQVSCVNRGILGQQTPVVQERSRASSAKRSQISDFRSQSGRSGSTFQVGRISEIWDLRSEDLSVCATYDWLARVAKRLGSLSDGRSSPRVILPIHFRFGKTSLWLSLFADLEPPRAKS